MSFLTSQFKLFLKTIPPVMKQALIVTLDKALDKAIDKVIETKHAIDARKKDPRRCDFY